MNKILCFLFAVALPALGFAQTAKPGVSLATMDDLRGRQPVQNEVVEVRHGSTTNLWTSPRLFLHDPLAADARDGVYVETNRVNSGRYLAFDRGSGTFDIRLFGAIPDDDGDDTAAIGAAAAALQAAGKGTLLASGGRFKVSAGPLMATYVVATFTNINGLVLDTGGAVFFSTDFGDETFVPSVFSYDGTNVSVTTMTPHGVLAGQNAVVKNASDNAYNGVWTAATVTTPTNLTYTMTAYNVPVGGAIGYLRVSDINRELFRFRYCTNVNIGRINFEGTQQPRSIQYRLGWVVARFWNSCRTIRGSINASGASYALYSGEWESEILGNCTDFDVDVSAFSVGYPVAMSGSGHESKFRVNGSNVHRGMYAGGVKQSSADIRVKNFDVAGVLVTHQPIGSGGTNLLGCEDSTFKVVDTGTTEPISLLAVGGTRYLAMVAGYTGDAVVAHRNIKIDVSCKNAPYTSGVLVQTYGTNQSVEGVTFSGYLDQRGLSSSEFRAPHFMYETGASAGRITDLAFKDFTALMPPDTGPYLSYLHASHVSGSILFDNYRSALAVSTALPAGQHIDTVPRFPNWQYPSFEAAQLQKVTGAAQLSGNAAARVIGTMASGAGTNDFTVLWAGKVPYSGDQALFTISSTTYSTNDSLAASIVSGNLVVRMYGATTADWRSLTVTNWLRTARGRVTALGLVRTASGLRIFTDGHDELAGENTAGTPPDWTGPVDGPLFVLGADDASDSFNGPVYRAAVWNYDRSADFPALAAKWDSGEVPAGRSTEILGTTTLNGSFETLGTGVGDDTFADWSEQADGSSLISVSTNAITGTNALVFAVDGAHSFAGISQSALLTPGLAYRVSMWARAPNGGANPQLAVVGPVDGDYVIDLTTNWQKFTVTKVWSSVTFALKRWNLVSNMAEVDDIVITQVGTLLDYDWTRSPADQTTGKFADVLGGTATRVTARGAGISDDNGNASVSLETGKSAPTQVWATDLTASRTVTFGTNGALRGDAFRLIRKDSGAGTLTALLTPSRLVRTNEWLDAVYNGTNWTVAAAGTLANSPTPDWINVKDFGAVGGDGTTDDTAAIQAALDSVRTSEGTLYFPPGRYRVSQSLDGTTAGTGFTIAGSGRDTTEIIGNDPGYPLLDFTGANRVTLRDLTVWGNAAGTNVSLCGILWGRPASNASSGSHLMERVKVWGNFQKWGVVANSAELCVYRECEFYAGYDLAPPDNPMTAFCLSGGSGTRGLTSRYNAPGTGSGGNSSQAFYDCKFFNYVPTTVTGYATTYNLELDGVMTCTMINPYYYSRYNGTQVKLNNLSTSAFDTLDIIGARHEYLTPLSGGTEPASYSAAATEKFKSIRIQGGTLTYFYGEGGSWITGLKINDVVWKTIASVPVVDVWILIDSDLTANKGGDGSFAQTQTPTYSIRGWSHNVNLDYQKTQNYGMHSSPDLGFGRRGLLWDGATDNSALLYNIPTNRIGTNDFTIYLRVRLPASMPGNHAGIATLTANPSGIAQASAWTARLNTDGRIETFLFDATGLQNQSKYVPLDFYTQNKGEICDLVFVRNTNDCRVYINGYYARGDEDQSTGSPPGWGAHINASVFALGISGAASQYWRSEMYRAALFDRALSDTEILALTHSTLQLDTDALIPNLTQGNGTTISDLGSGNYSGTLVGGVSHLLLSRPQGLAGWVDVTAAPYNATGDGLTDDTAALQSAADAVPEGGTLFAPAGKIFVISDDITITNSRVNVDFSSSPLRPLTAGRKAALQIGPINQLVTNLNFVLDPTTSVIHPPAGTFAAGDMVMLYNDVQSPAGYYPGLLAFVMSAVDTNVVLDRFPPVAMNVTNVLRFVSVPRDCRVRNVVVDLAAAGDGIGISLVGRGHTVENCYVVGTGTTSDPNYIGIELRGQSLTARKNYVEGILDADNNVDRSGYGIFATGDNITVEQNELGDSKHCISTSERRAISPNIRLINNRVRQRFDWAALTNAYGAYLFTGAVDVHANVKHAEIRGNDILIGGRYALSLRNGDFDVLYNNIEVVEQAGLPFSQHGNGIAEAFITRGVFVGNRFKTPTNTIHFYFDRADSGISGTHSNLMFQGNTFVDAIFGLDDTSVSATNAFIGVTLIGNTFTREVGTPILWTGAASNVVVTGNRIAYGEGGNGMSFAMLGDDSTVPPREFYVAGNAFRRLSGAGFDIRVLSGPTNVIELGQNRFSDAPISGFQGRVAVSRTPPSDYRFQLIEADNNELVFNSTLGTEPARLRWGGAGAVMGYETEFYSYRLAATDRAFSSSLPGHSQRDFVIKADGLQSWSDGTNAAKIVFGPRDNADLVDGNIRLNGGLALTARPQPIQPISTAATLYLTNVAGIQQLCVVWGNGSNSVIVVAP